MLINWGFGGFLLVSYVVKHVTGGGKNKNYNYFRVCIHLLMLQHFNY